MKFSIITVCYNAQDEIEKTIQSVLSQTYIEYEYIIVDGKSTDHTLAIIEKYAQVNDRIRFISEADSGLYHAMNKGIGLAKGDYIQFLNAGDFFVDVNVLSRVSAYTNMCASDVLFGNIIYQYRSGKTKKRVYKQSCAKALYYLTGDCINHQAMFASRSCFDNCLFDYENYRICADREWMMRLCKKHVDFNAIGETIVQYSLSPDSISVKNKALRKKEEAECIKKHFPLGYPIYLIFEFFRSNKRLKKVLHSIYKKLYITD